MFIDDRQNLQKARESAEAAIAAIDLALANAGENVLVDRHSEAAIEELNIARELLKGVLGYPVID